MEYKGSFAITKWDEDTLTEKPEGVKTSHATIAQTYSGDMSGESSLELLMSYQSQLAAKFTGFETFIGAVNGMRGAVTFLHHGKFENGVASSDFSVVEGSATGELAGKVISGSFVSGESGKANYMIEVLDS